MNPADELMRKLDEGDQAAAPFEAIVKTRCICSNGGRPDEQGYIAYSPSCLFPGHGVRGRHIERTEINIDLIGDGRQWEKLQG